MPYFFLFLTYQSTSKVSELLKSPPTTHVSFLRILCLSALQRMSVPHTRDSSACPPVCAGGPETVSSLAKRPIPERLSFL